MRYRPKSAAALQIALGGLPNNMRVEVDPDVGVSARLLVTFGIQQSGPNISQ